MCRPAALALAALGLAAACEPREPPPVREPVVERCAGELSETGDATHYDATEAGSCSFPVSPDRMVAALNGPDYARAAWCGACLAVAGPLGDVIVRVVDECPGCKHGDLDLSREAFAQIAPLSAGRVHIDWREIACPVSGPIAYQVKPGSNAHWTAIQPRNHRYAIARLEARDAAGAYRALVRGGDNYFAAKALGPGPYALRATDAHGRALEDRGIALAPGALQPGAAQFPDCP